MKYCIECKAPYEIDAKACPVCGSGPEIINGFECYAPTLAHESEGFRSNYFADLARLEADNFWFRSRNKLILWALAQYAPGFGSLLEVGCGTGFALAGIHERFPDADLSGSEIFIEALRFARQRIPNVCLAQMDARRLPFHQEFDVLAAFDVLEHIKQDDTVLSQMYRAIKPGGRLLVTVPQHAWLWSTTDEYACHERRYAAKEIHAKIEAAGFEIVRSTSFVTALLPAMLISRLLQRGDLKDFDPLAEYRINPLANKALEAVLSAERAGIKRGFNYPVGGTRLIVAAKGGL